MSRRESIQCGRIRNIMNTYFDGSKKVRRRGAENQYEARHMERSIRRKAVAFRRWVRTYGWNRAAAARIMGISARTLSEWERGWSAIWLSPRPLGRPADRSTARQRGQVVEFLDILGPHTGLPTLRASFPELSKGEAFDLLHDFRRKRLWGKRVLAHVLKWLTVGATWAMDFTEALLPVDGRYKYILSVRDLASHYVLMWLAFKRDLAKTVASALLFLFAVYGFPLVIKHDGGSHFKGEVKALLAQSNVATLISPPYTPEYNGSIESGIGNITAHTHYEAARQGRPYEWTAEDLEAARLRTNTMTRPFGHRGPTPEELWRGRSNISSDRRKRFVSDVERIKLDLYEELGYNRPYELYVAEEPDIRRKAVSCACVAHDLLEFRRSRNSLPIIPKKGTIIL